MPQIGIKIYARSERIFELSRYLHLQKMIRFGSSQRRTARAASSFFLMNIKLDAASAAAQGLDQFDSLEFSIAIQLMETQKKLGLLVIDRVKMGCRDL